MKSVVFQSEKLSGFLCEKVLEIAQDSIEKKGSFSLAVSGGSLPSFLTGILGKAQFDKWCIFLADERVVPLSHNDSNFNLLSRVLFDKMSPKPMLFPINYSDNPHKVAQEYQSTLVDHFAGVVEFDLVLLGMGPDGHTCSLFPNHPILLSTNYVDYLSDSPKPPPVRITLTLKTLELANHAIFVVTGKGKRDVLKKIMNGSSEFPAGNVKVKKDLLWLIDEEANPNE